MCVLELIRLLEKYPKNAVVKTNGCQMCTHQITGVEIYQPKDSKQPEIWLTIED